MPVVVSDVRFNFFSFFFLFFEEKNGIKKGTKNKNSSLSLTSQVTDQILNFGPFPFGPGSCVFSKHVNIFSSSGLVSVIIRRDHYQAISLSAKHSVLFPVFSVF